MAPQKRTAKKRKKAGKKTKKAARPKKLVRRKKASAKKKPARKVKRVAAPAAARRHAPHKGERPTTAQPPVLGDWTEDAAEDSDQPSIFEDDITPDYGGSK